MGWNGYQNSDERNRAKTNRYMQNTKQCDNRNVRTCSGVTEAKSLNHGGHGMYTASLAGKKQVAMSLGHDGGSRGPFK